jgi:hypothetical protein
MAKQKPRKALRFLGTLFLAAIVGGVVGYLGPHWADGQDWPDVGVPGLLLAIVLAFFLSTAWHEAGHLVAGLLAGFAPSRFIVGPVHIEWIDGKARWRFALNLRFFGGLAGVVPRDVQNLARRRALLVAGGPVANLLLAAVAVPAALHLAGQGAGSGIVAYLPLVLLFLGLFSALLGLLSLIPSGSAGLHSDGGQLLRIWRGGPPADWDGATWAVAAAMLAGRRLRETAPELLEKLVSLPVEEPELVRGHLIAFSVALDQGDSERAAAHLESAGALVEALAPMIRPAYYLEKAYMAARYEQNKEAAKQALARSKGGVGIEPASRRRVESAVALAEGDPARAADLARQGLALLADRQHLNGGLLLEQDLLQDLLQACEM